MSGEAQPLPDKGHVPRITVLSEPRTLGELIERSHPLLAGALVAERRHEFIVDAQSVVSFVVPIHDQGHIIYENLMALTSCAAEPHEVVLVLDGCTDGTHAEVRRWVERLGTSPGRTTRVIVLTTDRNIYETASDALGVRLAQSPYVIEVQADILLEEAAFDSRMIAALTANPDVFAVSGRGIHGFSLVRRPVTPVARLAAKARHTLAELIRNAQLARRRPFVAAPFTFWLTGQAGRLAKAIDLPQGETGVCLFVGGTVIRGPLAFARHDYDVLGGFDTQRFFLGNDDHDLLMRAHRYLGRTGAYLPIKFSSPLANGSTRKPRSPDVQAEFERLRADFSEAARTSELNSGSVAPIERSVRTLEALANNAGQGAD